MHTKKIPIPSSIYTFSILKIHSNSKILSLKEFQIFLGKIFDTFGVCTIRLKLKFQMFHNKVGNLHRNFIIFLDFKFKRKFQIFLNLGLHDQIEIESQMCTKLGNLSPDMVG